jgi:hypothetical protein
MVVSVEFEVQDARCIGANKPVYRLQLIVYKTSEHLVAVRGIRMVLPPILSSKCYALL